ncbi:MAG: peptide chain release factor 2 [Candidatus Marinimicrobia bacterium]|nr:peptide chain release factor 2 [Candidatus Neomarinimicrobiota bacterium]
MDNDLRTRLEATRGHLAEMRGYLDYAVKDQRLQELERQAADPEFWNNPARARALINETNALRGVLQPLKEAARRLDDLEVLFELAAEEPDPAQGAAAAAEAERELTALEALRATIEVRTLLNGRFDANNAYLTLHAGAGGTESCDWTEMLFRMYHRFAERQGFELSVLDCQPGEEAGMKSVSLLVSGPYAYGYLKAERGVHRLVRISPFDANKRRHTSFASLDVVAEVDDDIEVEIRDEDLRVDTYRSGGAGGQHVNKTDSAIRLTHLPTGIVVQCQAERSQHKNRDKAMHMLRARIYEYEQDLKRKDLERFYGAKGEIAWGSQIRSYVLQPYTMAKDHRTDTETGNVQAVLDGDLERFIQAYLKHQRRDAEQAS